MDEERGWAAKMRLLGWMMLVIWWCMMMMMMVLLPATTSSMALEVDECGQTLGYNTVSYDLQKGIECYPKFLTRLRNQVEAPKRACGFPVTRSDPLSGREYLTVDLKITNRQWVTLGIDVKDLYIWGYQDRYNGDLRATFVDDAPDDAKANMFADATIRRTTPFGGSYGSLLAYARIKLEDQQLTIRGLSNAILQLYGKPESQLDSAEEAKFFLLVVQMVSEAARFKFIEEGIFKMNKSPEFKLKIIAMKNDWDKISKAIHRAEAEPINKCTEIKPPIVVGYQRSITNVDDIRGDMALLKYNRTDRHYSSDYYYDAGRTLAFLESADVVM